MPSVRRTLAAALALAALSLGLLAAVDDQAGTFTGTLGDIMCGRGHMMDDVSAAECTRECVKMGSGYALISDKKVYRLKGGDEERLNELAGEEVTIQGELNEDTIQVRSVAAARKTG